MGGMCIDPCPSELFMGRLRIHPRPNYSLICRMGINPHLSDSLMGRMRLFSYAIVLWQVQHIMIFYFYFESTTTQFNGIADCKYYFL